MGVCSNDGDVEVASEEDVRVGVSRALERLGLTYEDLAAQAAGNHFSSEEARLVWFAISPRDGAVC
jgi:hypothetical protein